jgi:penicillin-binding protein 2A
VATTRKQSPNKSKPNKKGISWLKVLLWAIISAIIAMICALGIYMLFIINGEKLLKENINKLEDVAEASHIYDVNGNEITTLYRVNREVVAYKDIPDKVKNAFIATEDRRFESHFGIDFYSLGRALIKDILHMSAVEGGSTITQQLAKNVFTGDQKTLFRKATELSIAIAIENNYSKDEIMGFYLNRIYFGNRAYGIKAAAKRYFGVSDLNDLQTWQIATLAAMPKAPSIYNPIDNPEKSKERRNVVLSLMAEQGYITEQERAEAAAKEYTPIPDSGKTDYATITDYVVKEAADVYGISEDDLLSNGYKIYTTIDPKAQKIMEQTYAQDKFFQKDAADGQKIQSSMVILNNKDGGIVAMIGGRGYKSKDLNRVVQQPRQPGSSFKPIIVYAPALETGKYTPYSMLEDKEQSFGDGTYTPHNYDGVYRGQVTMYEAVEKSINLPAVWLLDQIGIQTGKKFAAKLGINLGPKDNNLAIALGGLTEGVTPLQMASAYSAFANNGIQFKPHSITEIRDDKNQVIASFKQQKNSVMSPKTAYYMTLLLQGVVESGTGTSAKFDRPVAGKTGTTQLDLKGLEKYNRDVWFVGYTPEWTAAVWEGFDKTDAKHYVTVGSGGPSVIFREVMSKALAGRPVTGFKKPDGVEDPAAPPNKVSGLAATYAKETNSVKLSWTPTGDNVQYQVFRKDSKQNDFTKLIDSATPEVNDITVQRGETYQYYVVAVNPDSNAASDRSDVVSVTVPKDSVGSDPLNPQPGNQDNKDNNGNPIGTNPLDNKNGSPDGKTGTGAGGTGTGTGPGTGNGSGTGAGGGAGSGTSGGGTGAGSGSGTGAGTGGVDPGTAIPTPPANGTGVRTGTRTGSGNPVTTHSDNVNH